MTNRIAAIIRGHRFNRSGFAHRRTTSSLVTDAAGMLTFNRPPVTAIARVVDITASGWSKVLCACMSLAARTVPDAVATVAPRRAIWVSIVFDKLGLTMVSVTT